jgi:dipeptidyl aminopeptidase/acylaminoacyl peptidase
MLRAPMVRTAPYGSWTSPITSSLIASGAVRLGPVAMLGDDVYALESRPTEGGRYVVVRRGADGSAVDVTPPGTNVRSRVHEYGGGSYLVGDGALFYCNFADQRLYRIELGPGAAPVAITPEPEQPAALRYADPQLTRDRRTLICVRERHAGGEVINELVALPADGAGDARILAGGRDFYAYPRIRPDGAALAWIQWDHPNMPWDGTELWCAELTAGGALAGPRKIAGGRDESIFQPAWSPGGALHFVSDRTGWWNLYRVDGDAATPLAAMAAEFGAPQWGIDATRYGFLADGTIACVYTRRGIDHLGAIAPGAALREIATPFTAIQSIAAGPLGVAVTAGGATEIASIARIALPAGEVTVIRRSLDAALDPGTVSAAQPIEFPTTGDRTAHALYYPPHNRGFAAPAGERPPLLVISHGGPTAAASGALNLGIQFWTSRGFAVVDVNYGGSSGYGRAYRERLDGTWGITDVDDCVAAARYLADQGLADRARLAIRGGSAGGYTTLAALTFRDVFAAGASYYGVADLEGLAHETHKFEARYLDRLIGPYPAARDLYRARSPVHHTDRLATPMILFQGLEDKVVPPSQAEAMVAALDRKAVPYAYLPFAHEQHGFRRAENIQRSLDAELYFYGRILGFQPADPIEPVAIRHLAA